MLVENSIKDIFRHAYEYANQYSQEDHKIGSVLIDQRGSIIYGSNREGKNPVVDLINKTKDRKQRRVDYSDSSIYITDRLMDDLTCKLLRKFKEVNYLVMPNEFKQSLNCDKNFFEEIGTSCNIYLRNSIINENDFDKWWTHKLYDTAYDIVKDRKFPVTIPGYNRPELPTLKTFKVAQYTDDLNWPFFVIVRESQKEMYEEATKHYKYVTIKSFPDEVINNAGAVRRTTQKWLNSLGIKATFQMDDDINYFGYSYAGIKEDGYPKSQYRRMKVNPYSSARVLAMWQLAMEKSMEMYDTCISCGQQIAFSWKDDYCWSSNSLQMMRGPMTQVVCFNIKKLCEEGIYHNNNIDVGFDDIDFTLRVIESGNKTCCFPWIVYGCEALGGGNGDKTTEDKLKSRFKENQEKLKSIHGDKSYVSFRPKRGLDQVCINWRNARKYQLDNYNSDLVSESNFDIWNNGELIN